MPVSGVESNGAIAAGDNHLAPFRQPDVALWFEKTGNPPRYLAVVQIDDIDGAIGNLGNEQATTGQIECKMIEPAPGVRKRNRPLELSPAVEYSDCTRPHPGNQNSSTVNRPLRRLDHASLVARMATAVGQAERLMS